MSFRANRLFIVLTVILSARTAVAQTAAPKPVPAAGFQDGFFVQSTDGEYRLVFGMVAQADGRFSINNPTPITNTFTLRKLRPTFTGQLTHYFTFKLMPDFGNGSAQVPDAYLEFRPSQAFRIRSGKDKTPVGYELLQGDANLWFPERALASSLVPNRDLGVEVLGDVAKGRVSYQGGIFNGVPDGSSTTTELDTNNSKDLAGRIVVTPFRTSKSAAVNGFGFHLGGSAGKETGALPSFKTDAGQTYFTYDTGVTAAGTRTRLSPAVFYYYKTFGIFGEYMSSTQTIAKGGLGREITNHATEVSASVMLTGEAATYGAVRPKNSFNPAQHHYGAVQLLARYTTLSVDRLVFQSGLASATASREATSFTVAANWFPNANVKYYATFERTTFDGGASARHAEDVILFRTQLSF